MELDPPTPLAVVVAPAGYGKSTVVQAWRARAEARTVLVGPGGLLAPANVLNSAPALLGAAVELGADPIVAKTLADLVLADGSTFGEDFLHGLSDLLIAIDTSYRIFIDDLHELTPPQIRELGRLIGHVGSASRRFVVAGRVQPEWPLQRWRLSGFGTTVSARDLRLTTAEVMSVIEPEFGADSKRLAAMIAGWPAAVQVMRWHAGASPERFTERVISDLADYVSAEVVPALPAGQAEILTELAILEPFPMAVGVEMVGHPETESVIFDTMHRTALVDIDDDGRVVIHPTLKSALLRTLRDSDPGGEARLHVRAAQAWLAQPHTAETFARAMDHYISASAWAPALQVLRLRWEAAEETSRLAPLAPERQACSWVLGPTRTPGHRSYGLRRHGRVGDSTRGGIGDLRPRAGKVEAPGHGYRPP